MATRAFPMVGYFPSYEMITGPQARSAFFEDDLREVRPEGVAYVMSVFARHYLGETAPATTEGIPPPRLLRDQAEVIREVQGVICDEEMEVRGDAAPGCHIHSGGRRPRAAARRPLPGAEVKAWYIILRQRRGHSVCCLVLTGAQPDPDWDEHVSLRISRLREHGLNAILPLVPGFHPTSRISVRRMAG
jgi:hypothetical protein